MKNKFFFYCNLALLGLASGMLLLFACKAFTPDNNESPMDETAIVEPFIRNLYNNYVFGYGDLNDLKENFDDSVFLYLQQEYSAEYDGEGYATWLLRTGCQDGPEDISSVDTIISLPDNWYEVKFTDLGNPGCRRLKISVSDSTPIIETFK